MKSLKIRVTIYPVKYPLFLSLPVSFHKAFPPTMLTTILKVLVPQFQNTPTHQTQATSFSKAYKVEIAFWVAVFVTFFFSLRANITIGNKNLRR